MDAIALMERSGLAGAQCRTRTAPYRRVEGSCNPQERGGAKLDAVASNCWVPMPSWKLPKKPIRAGIWDCCMRARGRGLVSAARTVMCTGW